MHLHPSYDATKLCGWHSSYDWEVKVRVTSEGKYTEEELEWLAQNDH